MTARPPRLFGRKLAARVAVSALSDWQAADPQWIAAALQASQARSTGGWFAVADARWLPADSSRTLLVRVRGNDYVLWRTPSGLGAALDRCPHMGASLAHAGVHEGCLVCPWHGRRLDSRAQPGWQTVPAHDDGVLLWLQLTESGEQRSASPILSPRPARFFSAVMAKEARCEPIDILANRLDPWHGAHYHPHAFARLQVVEQLRDEITVRVVYRLGRWFGIEVDARFHCPDARTITMTIVAGEGTGSVVETHATPIETGRTLVLEDVLAHSERPQFWWFLRSFGRALRPLVERSAHKLWREDAAYAERLYRLRTQARSGPAD